MMKRFKVVTIVGTRPEVIKMAPVIRELERRPLFDARVVATAQHREMLDQVLEVFGIRPDEDLGLMQHNQDLAGFAARSLVAVSNVLMDMKPDIVLIQGDTTTVMTAALAAFYQRIAVGHVEAGLRSFDRRNPFPEEINRRVTGCLADLHFAPTERARQNLLREGIPADRLFVTGNTIVDALTSVELDEQFEAPALVKMSAMTNRLLLVTAHRRENHGEPLRSICLALKHLASHFADIEIVYPVHLNPKVSSIVREELGGIERIHLVDPVSYPDLLRLMRRSYLILSDSGGIQEEAPSFHKPVLVLREVTERPEIIEVGGGRLVGTRTADIIEAASLLLTDRAEYERMCSARNPFGDGQAAKRIVDALTDRLPSLSYPL